MFWWKGCLGWQKLLPPALSQALNLDFLDPVYARSLAGGLGRYADLSAIDWGVCHSQGPSVWQCSSGGRNQSFTCESAIRALEAMQERQVTIGDQTWPLPAPFLVLATQNPLEQEGTYPLPEAKGLIHDEIIGDLSHLDEELEILDLRIVRSL